jgi:acylphosphatase
MSPLTDNVPSEFARRLIISGRVQGVGFRAFVKHSADKLGLDGFVRNRTDGTVEALVTGASESVEKLIVLCHEGPPASRVSDVQVSEAQGIVDKGFKQLPTV